MKLASDYTSPHREPVYVQLDTPEGSRPTVVVATDTSLSYALTECLGYSHHKDDLYLSSYDGSSLTASDHGDSRVLLYEFWDEGDAEHVYEMIQNSLTKHLGYEEKKR